MGPARPGRAFADREECSDDRSALRPRHCGSTWFNVRIGSRAADRRQTAAGRGYVKTRGAAPWLESRLVRTLSTGFVPFPEG
jgi:hypothetical protein